MAGRTPHNSPIQQTHTCTTCTRSIVGPAVSIKCSICSKFFHGNIACAGVQANVVKAVANHLGHQGAFAYRCIKCRVSPPSASPDSANPDLAGAIAQLSDMFNGLATTVAGLKDQISNLSARPSTASGPAPVVGNPAAPGVTAIDPQLIRAEIREMYERDRRSESIIIRGITTPVNNNQSNAEFMNTFKNVVSELLPGKTITLTNFMVIKPDENLVRATISDGLLRRDLLSVAKNLRSSTQFGGVFISRDLTYNQRGASKAKRAKARIAAAARNQPPVSTIAPPLMNQQPITTTAPLSASASVPVTFFR